MKKGTRVSWLAKCATKRRHGVTISDEEKGRVLVAVDEGVFENIPLSYHMVILCQVTWLTQEPNPDPKPEPAWPEGAPGMDVLAPAKENQ